MKPFSLSRIVEANDTPLLAWLNVHRPIDQPESADSQLFSLITASSIKACREKARSMGAVMLDSSTSNEQREAETREMIGAGTSIVDGIISNQHMRCPVDGLIRNPDRTWTLVMFSSAPADRSKDVQRASFTADLLRDMGESVRSIHVWAPNPEPTGNHDLLATHNITQDANWYFQNSSLIVAESAHEMLSSPTPPPITDRDYLKTDKNELSRIDPRLGQDSVFALYRIRRSNAIDLLHAYGPSMFDVPAEALSDIHLAQVQASRTGQTVIHPYGLNADTPKGKRTPDPRELPHVLYHLDFETFADSLGSESTRPYQNIPFCVSVTAQYGRQDVGHTISHIVDPSIADPRREIAHFLAPILSQCKQDSGSLCCYNTAFEKACLKDLALYSPTPEDSSIMTELAESAVDLMPVFTKSTVVTPGPSRSLKKVADHFLNGNPYEDLAIRDGATASLRYTEHRLTPNLSFKERDLANIRRYCEVDTRIMPSVLKCAERAVENANPQTHQLSAARTTNAISFDFSNVNQHTHKNLVSPHHEK